MDNNANQEQPEDGPIAETHDRRETVRKLGKFAAYAAPFTVLALTKKADAATGGGPNPMGARRG